MTSEYCAHCSQALPGPEMLLQGNDGCEVDLNAGKTPGSGGRQLAQGQYAALEALLRRNEFYRDCMAPQQLILKVVSAHHVLRN